MLSEDFKRRHAATIKTYHKVVWTHRIVLILMLTLIGYCINDPADTLDGLVFLGTLLTVGAGYMIRGICKGRITDSMFEAYADNDDVVTLSSYDDKPLPVGGPVLRAGAIRLEATSYIERTLAGRSLQLTKARFWHQLGGGEPTTRSDARQFALDYVILTVDAGKNLPKLFIDGRSQNRFKGTASNLWALSKKLSRTERLQDLEGDFPEFFTVYASKGTQTEALSILAPDAMIRLRDRGYQFDFEIDGRWLHIIHEPSIGSIEEFEAFFESMRSMADELVPQLAKQRNGSELPDLTVKTIRLGLWATLNSSRIIAKYALLVILGLAYASLAGYLLQTALG